MDVGFEPMTTPTTIPELVRAASTRYGDRDGLVDDRRSWTFAELADDVARVARALVARGLAAGDRVAIWAPNVSEWIFAALGAHTAGAVLIPLNTRFKGPEAAYVLEASGARMLFTVTDFLDTDYVALLESAGRGAVEEIVVLRGSVPDGCTAWMDFLARADDVNTGEVRARGEALRGDDVCDILFTSGTTGRPKGAMLMHAPSIRAYDDWSSIVGLREGDRYLIVNPFFHAFGLKAGILASLLKGATIFPHPVFDVPSVLRRVSEEHITMLPGPPAIFQTILARDDLDDFELSSLRLSVTGAAPIPTQMIVDMRERLGFENVVTGYGLTEAHGIATMNRHDDDPETIARTDGRPIPGVEVCLVDAEGVEVPTGSPGEILVRGYNLMRGYLDDPPATAEAIDADGWLHTGDVGVLDERGNLTITDRIKDMYIVGGFNTYPAEIEKILTGHDAVTQAAVIGVPDERLGEVGMAFVVADPDRVSPDEIIAWAREQMANFKVPRYVEIVDALPMNASNKVVKPRLREQVEKLLAERS